MEAPAVGTHPLPGAHVSWWVTEGVELSGRVGRVGRPPRQSAVSYPVEATVAFADRSKEFVSAVFVYHFLRDLGVRPMVGIGAGVFSDAQRVTCHPVACGDIPGRPPGGFSRRWRPDVILALGLSGMIRDRWVWRVGCLSHAFMNDHNSTIELFAGAGYRFGGR